MTDTRNMQVVERKTTSKSAAGGSRRLRAVALNAMALAAVCTGCMTSPGDGEFIGTPDTAVQFEGVSGYSDEWIAIQAWNSAELDWDTIGYTLTDEVAVAGTDGELFAWSKSVALGDEHWIWWGSHYKANVRAVVYYTGEICYAESGEEFATIWSDYPQTIEKGDSLTTR
ncbi:MAG: hypothetical protein KDB14_27320 [Planctomycetales bacterium]|nr:hypothetical protein [Planctomycetales bacterium]